MKKTQRRVLVAAVAAAALSASVLLPGSAIAKPKPAVQTTITVVAEGLDTPRGLIYDRLLRRVLVAEAGDRAGNNGPCGAGNGGVIYCYGETGAVFQYSEIFGTKRQIATGLPSLKVQDGVGVLGVHDLSLQLGRMTGVFGLSGSQATFRDALTAQGAALASSLATSSRIDLGQGNLTVTGDMGLFEDTNNPDGRRIDSDPFGVHQDLRGTFVADAAGNDIIHVTHDGVTQMGVSLPPRNVGGDPDYESVPTHVSKGPDGAYYIGELTGFPYHMGTARVLRWEFGAPSATVYAEGFTNIADLLFDDKGRLVVLEMAKFGLASDTDSVTGRLVRVERNGTQTELASAGLENPGGVAYAGDGVFYVTNRTTSEGNVGQLLKLVVRG